MVEESDVGVGGGVVELVDDHDVELGRIDRGEVGGRRRSDRREHVVPLCWSLAAHPEFAEGAVLHDVAEHVSALSEDAVSVGDEEQSCSWQLRAEVSVVEGRR